MLGLIFWAHNLTVSSQGAVVDDVAALPRSLMYLRPRLTGAALISTKQHCAAHDCNADGVWADSDQANEAANGEMSGQAQGYVFPAAGFWCCSCLRVGLFRNALAGLAQRRRPICPGMFYSLPCGGGTDLHESTIGLPWAIDEGFGLCRRRFCCVEKKPGSRQPDSKQSIHPGWHVLTPARV